MLMSKSFFFFLRTVKALEFAGVRALKNSEEYDTPFLEIWVFQSISEGS